MEKVKAALESGDLKELYIFTGDKYLMDIYLNKIKLKFLASDNDPLNLSIISCKEGNKEHVNAKQIIEQARTIPFLADKRIIIVKNSNILTAKMKEEGDYLKNHLKEIPDTSMVIFIEQNIDKRNGLYKQLNKEKSICEFNILPEARLVEWIIKGTNKRNCSITTSDALFFIEYVRGDMTNMINELSKCLDYVGTGDVTRSVIEDICHENIEVIIFKLMTNIANKKITESLITYRQLLATKEPAYKIFSLIQRQIRLLLITKQGLINKMKNPDIALAAGVMEFVVRELITQCNYFEMKELINLFYKCEMIERDVKTGKIDIELAIELFIIEINH